MTLNYNVTEDALWVMTFAEMGAARDGRDIARPVDVLLGLMLVGDPGFSSRFECLGGFLLREACAHPDDLPTLRDLGWEKLPEEPAFGGKLTPGVSKLLHEASLVSQELGVSYIGSEHLLIVLVSEWFDSEVEDWLVDAELTESGVLRRWVALMIRAEQGDLGLGPTPIANA